MVKEFDRSLKRNRERRKIIVLGCEGKNNKTEEIYFTSLERKYKKYHFVFAKGKNDPIGIVKNTINKAKENEIDIKNGDFAFSVFDVDLDRTKEAKITLAKDLGNKSKYKVEVITSNPCFEVWYLQHFIYSTKPYNSSSEVIVDLNKYIKDYSKTKDYGELLLVKTNDAINNSIKLIEYNKKFSKEKNPDFYNPSTNIKEIVELTIKK